MFRIHFHQKVFWKIMKNVQNSIPPKNYSEKSWKTFRIHFHQKLFRKIMKNLQNSLPPKSILKNHKKCSEFTFTQKIFRKIIKNVQNSIPTKKYSEKSWKTFRIHFQPKFFRKKKNISCMTWSLEEEKEDWSGKMLTFILSERVSLPWLPELLRLYSPCVCPLLKKKL